MENLITDIFDETVPFDKKALGVFAYQFEHNEVYRRFCESLEVSAESIGSYSEIPLIPIEAFKDATMTTRKEAGNYDLMFQSSGTSGMSRSQHLVYDAEIYRMSIMLGFNQFYPIDDLIIWAYLPGYNENPYSSLIWMMKEIIHQDTHKLCKFLEIDQPINNDDLNLVKDSGKKLMIFGAAFGLLDLVENHPISLSENSIIVETGGMKTFRRAISREKLHERLAKGFSLNVENIHSEYGMAEMLSQAYAKGGEWFEPVPWLEISIRDPDNPMGELEPGERGLIGILDLANIYSCSFFLTGDEGIKRSDDTFRVLGRWKPENLRGCNFLIDQE